MSIAEYIAKSETGAVAAIYQDDKAVAFICNREDMLEKLRPKGLCMHAKDFITLFETVEKAALVAGVYKGSQFVERSLTDKVS
jgi:hypothetical protein